MSLGGYYYLHADYGTNLSSYAIKIQKTSEN